LLERTALMVASVTSPSTTNAAGKRNPGLLSLVVGGSSPSERVDFISEN